MAGNAKDITDATFEAEVLNSDIPVLVDFWAPWCGPCKMIGPVVEELAGQYAGTVKVCKMNVDENGEVPRKFNVRGIPTLLLFKGGQVVNTIVGAVPKGQIENLIKSA